MPKTPEEPRELKSPRDIMLEKGLQHDDSPTNEPDVNVAANGDMNVTYPERFLRFNVTSISKQRRKFDGTAGRRARPRRDSVSRAVATSGRRTHSRLRARRQREINHGPRYRTERGIGSYFRTQVSPATSGAGAVPRLGAVVWSAPSSLLTTTCRLRYG